jgi:hypothetical protein
MYALQAFKEDTLASDITNSATSLTLTTGNFGSPSGTQILILDYDVSAKREIIKCTISGTSITSITRGVDSTSAVAHSTGAKILMGFTPSHYGDLGKIGAADAWDSWTPSYSASGSMTYTSVTTNRAKYLQLGKLVFFTLSATGTTGGTASNAIIATLPVTAAYSPIIFAGGYDDGGGTALTGIGQGSGTGSLAVSKADKSNFGLGAGRSIYVSGVYEAA